MLAPLALVLALSSAPLDSQAVLERYAARLLAIEPPKTLIFTYSVSQAGPHDLEQTHRIYRSGDLVRDETLMVEGQSLKQKITHIARYRNRYTVENLAPRLTQYGFLFQHAIRNGSVYNYVYRAVPLGPPGQFVVDGMTVDGRTFLPSEVRFHLTGVSAKGTGTVAFGQSGKYWVPTAVSVEAKVAGKPAREHITFNAYQFPASLPKSTFQAPKPLPTPATSTF